MMMMRYIQILGLMSLMPLAHADVIYTFDQGGSCCGTGIFATLTLHSVDADTVMVTETLTPGNVFAFTGAGSALDFNIDKSFSIVPGTLTTGFSLGGSDSPSPFPSFTSSISCTSPCIFGSGSSAPNFFGPLSFEVTNPTGLSTSDFVASTGGVFFASDIGIPKNNGFTTGNVGALAGLPHDPPPPGVPEPSSMILLATGLGAVVMGKNRLVHKFRSSR